MAPILHNGRSVRFSSSKVIEMSRWSDLISLLLSSSMMNSLILCRMLPSTSKSNTYGWRLVSWGYHVNFPIAQSEQFAILKSCKVKNAIAGLHLHLCLNGFQLCRISHCPPSRNFGLQPAWLRYFDLSQ